MAKKKETTAAVPVLEFIELSLVRTSALNPRKEFHEVELSDLTASIKKLGVIQPITVRKHPEGGYELVCGERRYHASIAAGLKEVPASIRELTDAEAMELMITENLQRKDVHPLEEADAFQFMIDSMGYELATIGARVGKNEPFVARRLQLIKLVPELKEAFKADRITIGHAELLSRIPDEDQSYWVHNHLSGYNGAGTIRELRNYLNSRVEKKLITAKFDTTVPFAETIECTMCPANSACNTLLFPDKTEEAICHNSACFNRKTFAAFHVELEKAIDDPYCLLLDESYGQTDSLVDNLKKEGYTILKQYDDYHTVYNLEPKKPKVEDYKKDAGESQDEFDTAFANLIEKYDSDIEDYRKLLDDIANGLNEYRRGFVVLGSGRGEYKVIELKSTKAILSSMGKDGSVTNMEQVESIRQKLKRGRELDNEKLHAKVKERINNLSIIKEFDDTKMILEPAESAALIALAYDSMGYSGKTRTKIHELLKLPDHAGNTGKEIYEAILAAPIEVRSFIVRVGLFNKFSSHSPNCLGGAVVFALAELWDEENFLCLRADQDAVCAKRELKLNKQLEELNK